MSLPLPGDRVETLRQTMPFGWLRERDIDLLLCSELSANARLQREFAALSGDPAAAFEKAIVSQYDAAGESDLVVLMHSPYGWRILLVENKIAADFQPDQGRRYLQRAEGWRREDGVIAVATVLVAPEAYLDRPGAETFGCHLSYERVAEVLHDSDDPRSSFLANRLADGVAAYLRGYTAVPDKAASDIWMACWEVAEDVTPALNLPRPTLKPGTSSFFYFQKAQGFTPADTRIARLVYKARHGNADLQFADTLAAELEPKIAALLDPDMTVVQAAKSACVRIRVPPIDFDADPGEQKPQMAEGLLACDRLRRLFVENRLASLIGATAADPAPFGAEPTPGADEAGVPAGAVPEEAGSA